MKLTKPGKLRSFAAYPRWMEDLQFTRDPGKAAANLSKHGVSFKVLPDPTYSEQEQRSLIIGNSGGRLLW